ncbi:aspartyl protease family protein [Reichenbachiella versicolor]|uniref:aspartyl protease family protein n=1 Tax=Reichenbachiella versicolor TaxID=1821036 RepID=UPI0013A56B41|nr:aspartyl protease family protein [Reichenbachiella versicolor]
MKTLKQGEVKQEDFLTEIPFYYQNNTIIIEVQIDGRNYNFIFDTGNDLTSIDDGLMSEISVKSNNHSQKVSDAQKNKLVTEFVSIESLSIAGVEFTNIGAQVFDHSPFEQVWGCGQSVSGIIGNNLMRKAKWQIDYKNRVLRVSDKIDAFDIQDAVVFETNSGKHGGARIEVALNDVKAKYKFDTGSSGFISSDLKTFDKLKTNTQIQSTQATVSSFTASGKNLKVKNYAYIEDIEVNNIQVHNQVIAFSENHAKLLGNKFFDNYLVTLDWTNELFYLKPVDEFKNGSLKVYEYTFAPNYIKNKVVFYNTWNDHRLNQPIDLNSDILSINGIELTDLTDEQLCSIWENQSKDFKTNKVDIEILENGKKRTVTLTKKQLLPQLILE